MHNTKSIHLHLTQPIMYRHTDVYKNLVIKQENSWNLHTKKEFLEKTKKMFSFQTISHRKQPKYIKVILLIKSYY